MVRTSSVGARTRAKPRSATKKTPEVLNPTGGITVTFVDQGLILQTIAPNDDDEHPDLSMLLAKSIGSSFKNWMAIKIRFFDDFPFYPSLEDSFVYRGKIFEIILD